MSTIESVNYWLNNQLDKIVVENIEDVHKKDRTTVENILTIKTVQIQK